MKLHNALTRRKETVRAADPAAGDDVCLRADGLRTAHIGNARAAVVFDVLSGCCGTLYGADACVYARNVTDVDDKIIEAARAEGVPIDGDHRRATSAYPRGHGRARRRCRPTSRRARPSTSPQMVAMIERLIAKPATPMRPRATCCSTCPSFAGYGACRGRTARR